jgi:hypothetical protein
MVALGSRDIRDATERLNLPTKRMRSGRPLWTLEDIQDWMKGTEAWEHEWKTFDNLPNVHGLDSRAAL